MRKKLLGILAAVSMVMSFAACGGNETPAETTAAPVETSAETGVELVAVETQVEETVEETREGMYRSELTNEWIDEALKDQRPIAAMVDNETTAYPHYGINNCDIVYEMMNSTQNGRITRLMCIQKDWGSIKQLGSIRSVRTTNFMVAAEYNAVILHDGGPFYIDEYIAKPYSAHISGGFARIPNGKAQEFTEYVTADGYTNSKGKSFQGLNTRIDNAGISRTYNEYYNGPHFQFANQDYKLSEKVVDFVVSAKNIALPFPHNSSALSYNESTGLYEYSCYGKQHVDALDGEVTSFKNVILQSTTFVELDPHGYLTYNVVGSGDYGWYMTNGEAIDIRWEKDSESSITHYYNVHTNEEIVLNTGKTYVALVPADAWNDLKLN